MKKLKGVVRALTLLAALAWCGACENDDDDWDHQPPAGQGALIIDNRTGDDLEIFVDGRLAGQVDDWDDRAFNYAPGAYRLVVREESGDRSRGMDLDILENRLTIVRVRPDTDYRRYDFEVETE